MHYEDRDFLPAAGKHWALPFYDPITWLLGTDKARAALLDQASLRPEHRTLDIGCGTGSFATLIKRRDSRVRVTGLDPDPNALKRARKKADKSGLSIQFDQGFSDQLPYPDASFDRVFSTFMFHHLPFEEKTAMLAEVRRVLAPDGSLHLLDFIRPENPKRGLLKRLLHVHEHLSDNSVRQIIEMMDKAGLVNPSKVAEGKLFFGQMHIGYYRASRA